MENEFFALSRDLNEKYNLMRAFENNGIYPSHNQTFSMQEMQDAIV